MGWFSKPKNNFLDKQSKGHAGDAMALIDSLGGGPASQSGTQDHHVRGTAVEDATDPAVQQALWQSMKPGQLQMGFVPIPFTDEQQHFLLAGAPGTGKSLTLKWLLRGIRDRGEKALVYDPIGDMVGQFYRPDLDIILNPLDQRDAGWYPWGDLAQNELSSFAKSIVPDPQGQADPFWATAGQAIVQALFRHCQSMDEVLRLAVMADQEELKAVIQKAGLIGLVGPDKTFSGVRATLAVPLHKLGALRNVTLDQYARGETFRIKEWVQNDDDRRWVFLLSNKSQFETLSPLLTLWTDIVVRAALSAAPNPERRLWLSLDELPSLGKLTALSPAMAQGRKYGLTAILGLQTIQQLRQIYGKEEAAVLYGLPKNRLILRINDQETSDEMSKELGEYQRLRVTTSVNQSVNQSVSHGNTLGGFAGGMGDSLLEGAFDSKNTTHTQGVSQGSSTSESLVIERAVLPSEIMQLPDLHGYVKAGGETVRVILPVPNQPWIESQPQHLPAPMRLMPWER
jgi:Type IV secretory pathway, VirD4 components